MKKNIILQEDQKFSLPDLSEDVEPTSVSFYDSMFKECGHEMKHFSGNPRTDGSIRDTLLDVGFEFKSDKIDLKKEVNQRKAFSQILRYMKDLKDKGIPIYKKWVIGNTKTFVGIDNKDCLEKYLDKTYINWEEPASSFYEKNQLLLDELEKDSSIKPYIINNEDYNDYKKEIMSFLTAKRENVKSFIDSTSSLKIAFSYWINNVIDETKDSMDDEEKHLKMFYDSIYCNGNLRVEGNILTNDDSDMAFIRITQYQKFFDLYNKVDVDTIGKLLEQKDVLVKKIRKIEKGINYTPTPIAMEAINIAKKVFGEDCFTRNGITWWDNSSATGNLTKKEKIKKLIQTDYYEENIEILENHKINEGSVKAQFDFLNDPISKLPKEAQEYVNDENEELGFIQNSPFKAKDTGNFGNYVPIPESKIRNEMKNKGYFSKECYDECWAQFIYRDIKIQESKKKGYLIVYTPSNFLTHAGYSSIRNFMHKSGYEYKGGFVTNAKYYGATDTFEILVSFWKKESNNEVNIPSEYVVESKDIIKKDGKEEIVTDSEKKILRPKDKTIWWSLKGKEKFSGYKVELPLAKSGLNIDLKTTKKIDCPYITILCCASEDKGAWFQVVQQTSNSGTIVTNENFRLCIGMFSALNINKKIYKEKKGNIFSPDDNTILSNLFEQYINDCHIYAALSESNTNCSFKIVKRGKYNYDVRNELFPLSVEEMMREASFGEGDDDKFSKMILDINSISPDTGYKNIIGSRESYMYIQIQDLIKNEKLSADSLKLYILFRNLVIKSFKYRKSFDKKYPALYLFRWDAGIYQIRKLLDEISKKNLEIKQDYDAFNNLFDKFENRLSEYLYKLGYLIK